MASSIPKRKVYRFGSFLIDVEDRLLYQDEEVVGLQPKTFDILLLLVENRGRVLEKETLMKLVWPDSFVEEANLSQNIYILRKLLSADPDGQRYIETIPKRGYRFVADVNELASKAADQSDETVDRKVISFPQSANSAAEMTASDTTIQYEVVIPDNTATEKKWSWKIAGLQSRPLRMLLAAVALVIALGFAGYYMLLRDRQPKPVVKTLAVLPFTPLGKDENSEGFGVGLAEDLVTRLSKTRKIAVRPTVSVLRHLAIEKDPIAAGQALKVDAVLTGGLRMSDDRIRVSAQLIRVEDGTPIWAEQFDEKLADFFTMQDHISEQLSQAMTLELSGEEKKLLKRHSTEDVEAFQLYLKAYQHWRRRTREGFIVAIDYLQQALKKDSNYALAHAGLAASYSAQSQLGFVSPREAMPMAENMANKALALDETIAIAHAVLGIVRMHYDWNLPEAEKQFRRAMELDPNFLEAYQYYALCLAAMGQFDKSGNHIQLASQIDPGSPNILVVKSWVDYLSMKHDEAIAECRKATITAPDFYLTYQHLGQAYAAKKMYAPAIEAFQRALALSANAPIPLARLGHAYGISGKKSEARQVLNNLREVSAQPHYIAWVHIGLGEKERSLEWLEKAYEQRAGDLIYLKTDTIYDSLRPDPKFDDLLRRIGPQQR